MVYVLYDTRAGTSLPGSRAASGPGPAGRLPHRRGHGYARQRRQRRYPLGPELRRGPGRESADGGRRAHGDILRRPRARARVPGAPTRRAWAPTTWCSSGRCTTSAPPGESSNGPQPPRGHLTQPLPTVPPRRDRQCADPQPGAPSSREGGATRCTWTATTRSSACPLPPRPQRLRPSNGDADVRPSPPTRSGSASRRPSPSASSTT